MSASGLAAVWATDNTREAIVAAMRRREVYATTGPRMAVRTFAGLNLAASGFEQASFPDNLAADAVPMGGEIQGAQLGDQFVLMIEASADPRGAYLDRLQVVKGWLNDAGETQEQIFDVAWSGGDTRLGDEGELLPVGMTVDLQTGLTANSIGAPSLRVVWRDPAFDPLQAAFYYVRVLQIPTARHSLLDALALGGDVDTRRPHTIQERAYTSPIWFQPSAE